MPTLDELAAQNDLLRQEIERLKAAQEPNRLDDRIPVQVTAAIIVASDLTNDLGHFPMVCLPQTLRRLHPGHQSELPMEAVFQPIVPDKDGAVAWLQDAAKHPKRWPASSFARFKVLEPNPSRRNIGDNVAYALDLLMDNVRTPYTLFVEPDTEPQPGVVFDLMKALESDEKLGIVGAQYQRRASHVKFGCSMMRTELAKEIEWRADTGCVCSWLCLKELPRRDLRAVHLEGDHRYARHLSSER